MKTLNPVDKEALYVGGSYLLSPVLSIAVALPIYFWTQHVVAALTAGSLAGIGLYIYSCIRSPDGSSAARAAEEYNLQMEKKKESASVSLAVPAQAKDNNVTSAAKAD